MSLAAEFQQMDTSHKVMIVGGGVLVLFFLGKAVLGRGSSTSSTAASDATTQQLNALMQGMGQNDQAIVDALNASAQQNQQGLQQLLDRMNQGSGSGDTTSTTGTGSTGSTGSSTGSFGGGGSVSTPGTGLSPREEVKAINTFMQTHSNVAQNIQMGLHATKVQDAAQLGEKVDSWGVVTDSQGNIDNSLSAKFTSASSIGDYIHSMGYNNLSKSTVDSLHAQKVALEAQLGNSVTSDGHVFDSQGHAVGANGMG